MHRTARGSGRWPLRPAFHYVGLIKVASTATDFTAQCLAMKQDGADYIYMAVAPQGAARLMQQCIQQGYTGLFSAEASSFLPALYSPIKGLTMVGTLNGFPWWVNSAPVETYRSAMTKYVSSSVDWQTSASTATWASLELLGTALSSHTGDVTRQTILDAMYSIKDQTLGGLLPQPVTYTAGQAAAAVNCFWQFKFVSGETNPILIPPTGTSGNGASGDLATACQSPTA